MLANSSAKNISILGCAQSNCVGVESGLDATQRWWINDLLHHNEFLSGFVSLECGHLGLKKYSFTLTWIWNAQDMVSWIKHLEISHFTRFVVQLNEVFKFEFC